MRNYKAMILGVALFGALTSPQEGSGQTISSPYRFVEPKMDLGPFAGWIITDPGSRDLGPQSGPVYGLQFAIRVSDPIQLSAFGGYFNSERNVWDPNPDSPPTFLGIVNQDIVLLSGRIQFNLTGARTWNNLIPYVFGGLGVAMDATSAPICVLERQNIECDLRVDERFDFGNPFMGQIGIGLVWLPTQRIGFRATFNDNLWQLSTPIAWLNPEQTLIPAPRAEEWTNNFQFALSISYWF